MEAHIALLRGINLGARNRIAMKELTDLFTGAGCSSVVTYIQSGNVVFRAPAPLARRIPALVQNLIQNELGLDVPIVVRSAGELRKVVKGNPFLRSGADSSTLHVVFLADVPAAAAVKSLDPKRSPPDAFAVRGRDIYLHCPNGFGRSKLSNAYFDSKLGTTSTIRNWRTVETLLELAGSV
jgi:uncharacterized protein (DUF1697 family)